MSALQQNQACIDDGNVGWAMMVWLYEQTVNVAEILAHVTIL